jgi:hypothetical protein
MRSRDKVSPSSIETPTRRDRRQMAKTSAVTYPAATIVAVSVFPVLISATPATAAVNTPRPKPRHETGAPSSFVTLHYRPA